MAAWGAGRQNMLESFCRVSEVSQFLSLKVWWGGSVWSFGDFWGWVLWRLGVFGAYPAPELQSACHIFPTIASRPFKGYLVYPL